MIRRALRNTMLADVAGSVLVWFLIVLLLPFGIHLSREWQFVVGAPIFLLAYHWIKKH
jgi:hypothetical protein